MFMQRAINRSSLHPSVVDHPNERGAGIVEWLGISALSIGMLVAVFAGLEQLGLDLIDSIRGSLGL